MLYIELSLRPSQRGAILAGCFGLGPLLGRHKSKKPVKRRILVAGNWKLHGSTSMVDELVSGITEQAKACPDVDFAVFPPYPYLAETAARAGGSRLLWGGQDVSEHASGAYTGEVSAEMLAEFGSQYVLVGHSERRTLHGESDTVVASKFVAAQGAGLIPVLCIGETLEERQSEQTDAVVSRQVEAVVSAAGINALENAIIAYEPVWAIGTGMTATPEQAESVHRFIRAKLAASDATIAGALRILYGGSVKGSNAAELFACENIDGGLIGGASLTVEAFMAIGHAAQTLN